MEKKKLIFIKELDALCKRYNMSDGVRTDFISEVKEIIKDNNKDNNNFKPFNLEAAKSGKSVCTRDGRKARIICFDAEGNKPLIVLSRINGQEVILRYTEKGQSDNFHSPTPREDDLMMFPEKKEGWVNVYKEDISYTTSEEIYQSKEEAIKANIYENVYLTTVKINWEE